MRDQLLPVKIAIEKNINLIFYAEHGESEYGGNYQESLRSRNLEEVLENQIGDHPLIGLINMLIKKI